MVAPLAVAVFLAVIQVAYLLVDRAVVQSAAHSGARVAATLGSTQQRGLAAAGEVAAGQGLERASMDYTWRRVTVSGVGYLELTASYPVHISWLGRTVVLRGSSAAVDENTL